MKTNIYPATGDVMNSSMTLESELVPSASESGRVSGNTDGIWTWDIRDSKLPEIVTPDPFDSWPDGPCKRVYCIRSGLEASRHCSGWAMRNTNNHNVNILKKSCLGVLVCNLRCGLLTGDGSRQSDLVVWRPAICDKARSKQIGQPCRTLGCSGVLELQRCQGPSGYPVTHFWRKNDHGLVFFQSKGTHNHQRPVKLHTDGCGGKGRRRLSGNLDEVIAPDSASRRHGGKPYDRRDITRRAQGTFRNLAAEAYNNNSVIPKPDLDSCSDPSQPILSDELQVRSQDVYDQRLREIEQNLLQNKLYSHQPPSIDRACLPVRDSQVFDTISGSVCTTAQYVNNQLEVRENAMEWFAEDASYIQSLSSTSSPRSTTNSWTSPNKLSTLNALNSSSCTQQIGSLPGASYSTRTPPSEELHFKNSSTSNPNSFGLLYTNLINSQVDDKYQGNHPTDQSMNGSDTSSQAVDSSFSNDPPSYNTRIGLSYSPQEFTQFYDNQLPTEERWGLKSSKIPHGAGKQWSGRQWSPDRHTDAYYYDSMQSSSSPHDGAHQYPSSQYFSLYFENEPVIQTAADSNRDLWTCSSSFDERIVTRPSIRHSLKTGEKQESVYANQQININMNKYIDGEMTSYQAGYEDSQQSVNNRSCSGEYAATPYTGSPTKYLSCCKFVAVERELETCSQSTRSSSDCRTDYDYFPCTPTKVSSGYDDEKFFLTPPRSAYTSRITNVYDVDDEVRSSFLNNQFDLYKLSDEYDTQLYDKPLSLYDESVLDDILCDLDRIVRDNDIKAV